MSIHTAKRVDGKDPISVFSSVYHSFEGAAEACGHVVDRDYSIAGHTVRLRFAGSSLLPVLTPALSHLARSATGTPVLTICIWDGRASGSHEPTLPAWWWNGRPRGGIQAYHGGRIHTAVHAGTLSMLDGAADRGLYWVGDPELACSEIGAPLLRIFHWWMRDHDLQLVHGGAVGTADGGVVLAGKGGSGKSTVSLLSIDSELLYAADDYCLVAADPSPYVHSLYCSGKIDARDIGKFSFLRPALSNADRLDTEKALYVLQNAFPQVLAKGFPLKAILVPRITACAETTITPLTAASGLLALAPSTIFQLPGAGEQALRTLGRVTARVPSFALELSTDFARVPGMILDLLSRL